MEMGVAGMWREDLYIKQGRRFTGVVQVVA